MLLQQVDFKKWSRLIKSNYFLSENVKKFPLDGILTQARFVDWVYNHSLVISPLIGYDEGVANGNNLFCMNNSAGVNSSNTCCPCDLQCVSLSPVSWTHKDHCFQPSELQGSVTNMSQTPNYILIQRCILITFPLTGDSGGPLWVNQNILDKTKGASATVAFLVGAVSRGQANNICTR